MQQVLSTLGRVFREKIGWKKVGIVASLLIVTIAVMHLFRTLKGVDTAVVLTALAEKSEGQIVMAALCVMCAFFTLTFYDLFALRTIGKMHVPYRIAALSSFTSYTVGHNIGATVFTGGAIRFRIYSDWGLTAIDVAKICFISGLTFWLGNTFVLGIGMIWHPAAAASIDLLPETINQLIGVGLLVGIAAYLTWIATGHGRRELGKDGWKVILPSAPLTFLVDLGFCAMAMSLLAPSHPDLDFVTLSVVFILATLLGFASHAPGSLGVFDAAMLIGLPMLGKEELLASLLVFRILYFLIPFATSITILGIRELWLSVIQPWQQSRKLRPAPAVVQSQQQQTKPKQAAE